MNLVTETICVDLGDHSYPIYIGRGLLGEDRLLASHIVGRRVLIVTNETVAPLYLARLKSALAAFDVDHVALPDGEEYKTLHTLNLIYDVLLENGHNRQTTIIALGGGVVGDTAGFAAATYQRGVAFIQMPTTLLSQVDSSVGGKTSVNHVLGKNMIGAFHQPRAVVIDTESLQTLPARELSAGLAEVIKHGALADAAYFHWLEAVMDDLLALNAEVLTATVKRSCEIKARVVAEDEKETASRVLLNFGHTFGHAIETAMGYGQWLHGEAVGAGMVMAADLSVRSGLLHVSDGIRLKELIGRAGLPVAPPAHLANEFMGLMSRDKKVSDEAIRFVLLAGLGKAVLVDDVDAKMLKATLDAGINLLA